MIEAKIHIHISTMWEENCCQPGILCLAQLSFKIHVDNYLLSKKQRLRDFITRRSEIQGLKGVFQKEGKMIQNIEMNRN